MPWLVRDGEVLASLDLAEHFGARLRGLLGRDGIDGGLLLRPAKSVHTIGMRFAIDVAFLDKDDVVVDCCTLVPNRIARTRWRAKAVIEAEAGAFDRWRIERGQQLEILGL